MNISAALRIWRWVLLGTLTLFCLAAKRVAANDTDQTLDSSAVVPAVLLAVGGLGYLVNFAARSSEGVPVLGELPHQQIDPMILPAHALGFGVCHFLFRTQACTSSRMGRPLQIGLSLAGFVAIYGAARNGAVTWEGVAELEELLFDWTR